MSLMSYLQLVDLVESGVIMGLEDHDQINASSIDVRLGDEIIIEMTPDWSAPPFGIVDPAKRTNFTQKRFNIREEGEYLLEPGEFILASTVEIFNLPNDISAEFRLKSSGARSGLNNLFACHCDPGWHGSSLTLELHNTLGCHTICLTPGMRIGQMLFHKHSVAVPSDRSYATRGRYNQDKVVSSVKL